VEWSLREGRIGGIETMWKVVWTGLHRSQYFQGLEAAGKVSKESLRYLVFYESSVTLPRLSIEVARRLESNPPPSSLGQ